MRALQSLVEPGRNSYLRVGLRASATVLAAPEIYRYGHAALSDGIDAWTAAILGVLQGLTEFLPVSSSGHVAIGAHFFGIQEGSLGLVVLLHLGTLAATVLLFRDDIRALAAELVASLRQPARLGATQEGRMLVAIAIATLATGAIGFSLRHVAEAFSRDLALVGYGFLVSAACLIGSAFGRGEDGEVSWLQALVVGAAQGIAVLPGVSRSGVTIAIAMLLGVQANVSFRFSFLASLPAIVAAAVYEGLASDGMGSLDPSAWVGGLTAMVTGYLALVILRHVILVGRMWTFALYLIPLGLFLISR